MLNMAVFVYIGAIIPWDDYSNPDLQLTGWRVVVLGITVLLPATSAVWLLRLTRRSRRCGTSRSRRLRMVCGPIGVGAVFYIQVALKQLPDDGTRDRLRAVYSPVVLFIVFSSVLTHGITILSQNSDRASCVALPTLTKTRSITFSAP